MLILLSKKNVKSRIKITCVIARALKGGCMRFEVEHISYNLLLYKGKT